MRRWAEVESEQRICLCSISATVPKLRDPQANIFNDDWVRFFDGRCKWRLRGPAAPAGFIPRRDYPHEFADRSSMVLARKKINGACHYLVQDNTGEWCSRLRPAIAKRCDASRVWLTEPELNKTIYSVIHLR